MSKAMLGIVGLIFILAGLAMLAYYVWGEIPLKAGSFDLGSLTNIAALIIAVFSLYVAVAAYNKSIQDSATQQIATDASREQLQAVVETATKQQEILAKNLETSKAQLGLLEEQWKREQERQARKPKLEITFNSRSSKELHDKLPLPLVLQPNRTATLTFVVANIGNSPVLNPLISVFVGPPSVRVDRPGGVYETKSDHDRYQTKAITLSPKETAGSSYSFTVEVLVPAEIETFKLLFRVHGDNLPHKDLDLTFRVTPHNN